MDVGQIITATAEPKNRDRDPYRNENDDFASYVNETATKDESPAQEKVGGEPAATDKPGDATSDAADKSTASDITSKKEAPSPTSSDETPVNAKAGTAAQSGDNIEATSVAPAPLPTTPANASNSSNTESVTEKSVAPVSVTEKSAKSPSVEASTGTTSPEKNATADAGKKSEPTAGNPNVNSSVKNSDTASSQVAAVVQTEARKPTDTNKAASSSQTGSEKTAVTSPADAKSTSASPDMLAALRAEANAKMSEKDVLSSKIAEMLRDGKGKISLTAAKQQQSFQTALASSTNLVTASMTNNPTASNPAIVTDTVEGPDGVLSQAQLPVSGNTQGLPADALNQTMPSTSTGSVQGVEATATNNMSQASNAARAAAHLPVAEQVSTQISTAIKEGQDRIKISLHPSELGRVEVKLDIGHDGRVLAVVSVDKQETLDLLQRDARSLERALQDAGFDTGSNSLNFGLSQNGQNGQGDDLNFANMNMPTNETGEDMISPELSLQGNNQALSHDSGLDIQV